MSNPKLYRVGPLLFCFLAGPLHAGRRVPNGVERDVHFVGNDLPCVGKRILRMGFHAFFDSVRNLFSAVGGLYSFFLPATVESPPRLRRVNHLRLTWTNAHHLVKSA